MNPKKICGEDLKCLVHNAYSTSLDEQGRLHLCRFTEKQLERYRFDSNKLGGNYGLVAEASSNITLEFETDSPVFGIHFDWTIAVAGFPWISMDLYVDGVLIRHIKEENPACHIMAVSLPPGIHHVQLFFPWNQNIIINHVVIAEGSRIVPLKKKKLRILSFGDSITQGYISDHPSLSYIGCVTRKLDAEVLNQAIGGYYFEEASLDEALADWKPDLITVAYGINNFSLMPSFEDFKRSCFDYVCRLTEIFPTTKILGIMPIYTGNERFSQKTLIWEYSFLKAQETLREAYRQNPNVTIMEDTFYPHTKEFFAPDELHPNDLGFLIYGDAVAAKIRSLSLKDSVVLV